MSTERRAKQDALEASAARIADELFEYLDGPVRRVASLDTWVAYAPTVENAILPQTPGIVDEIVGLAAY